MPSYWIPYALAITLLLLISFTAVWLEIVGIKDLVIALLPLVTTFAGATLAFRLNVAREAEKEGDRRKQALNTALFILVQQDNAIRQLLRDYNTRKNALERAFNLPANKPPEYTHLKVPIADLVFLLELNPQLLFELSIEQERFDQALEAVRIRNLFYVDEVQPAIERAGILGQPMRKDDVELALGQRVFGAAMHQAQTAFDHLNASKDSIPRVVGELRDAAKGLFPQAPFVAYEATPDPASKS